MDIIAMACYRVPDWEKLSSDELATAIVQPAALNPLTMTGAFCAAVLAGADLGELGAAYSKMNNEYVVNLRDALHHGDFNQVQVLIQIGAAVLGWSEKSLGAIQAILAANTLRLVDVVAIEKNESAPPVVSAADIEAALGK
jgi:hypothetical protein